MKQLKDKGLDRIIPQLEMPVLGICLGMQLMCRFSEEENTWGLGIFPMEVKKFADSCKVPHMGWNTVRKLKTTLFQGINPVLGMLIRVKRLDKEANNPKGRLWRLALHRREMRYSTQVCPQRRYRPYPLPQHPWL